MRHLIDGVDVINALGVRLVALMHRVQAQKAGLALRLRFAPLANHHRSGPRFSVVQQSLAVTRMLAQVVKMRDRNGGQPHVLRLLVDLVRALQNAPCGRAAQGLVRLVDRSQQFDVGPRVELSETPPPIDRHLDPPTGCVALDQARNLRPAQAGHLLHVAPQQATRSLALLGILLPHQHLLHPAVELLAVLGHKPDILAGRNKPANRFQTQLLCIVHADVHYPA